MGREASRQFKMTYMFLEHERHHVTQRQLGFVGEAEIRHLDGNDGIRAGAGFR